MKSSYKYSMLASSPELMLHVLAWFDGQDMDIKWGEQQDQLRSCVLFLLHHKLIEGTLDETAPVLPYGLIFEGITPKGHMLLEECRRWDLLRHAIAV